MDIEISLEDLLKNGSHFGHNKKRWNPKMEKYIYGEKNGTHIIDLRKSLPLIENALKFAHESAKNKKKFLFVSTKKQHSEIVENIAKETNNYFVNFRWLGGMITNWNTVKNSINTLNKYENILNSEDTVFTKKELSDIEKKKTRLDKTLGGIVEMKSNRMRLVDMKSTRLILEFSDERMRENFVQLLYTRHKGFGKRLIEMFGLIRTVEENQWKSELLT